MKNINAVAALLGTVLSIHAGTIKFPASPNITRNAGTEIPLVFTGSGWPAGAVCHVSLLNARTWEKTWMREAPIYNGSQQLPVFIPWNWGESATYLVVINSGSAHCTSAFTVRIRTAVIWPYGGVVLARNRPAAVTWTVPQNWPIGADYLEIALWPEGDGGAVFSLDAFVDPESGRLDFIVPDTAGTYRIILDGWYVVPDWWNEEVDGPWLFESWAWTKSEKITIR